MNVLRDELSALLNLLEGSEKGKCTESPAGIEAWRLRDELVIDEKDPNLEQAGAFLRMWRFIDDYVTERLRQLVEEAVKPCAICGEARSTDGGKWANYKNRFQLPLQKLLSAILPELSCDDAAGVAATLTDPSIRDRFKTELGTTKVFENEGEAPMDELLPGKAKVQNCRRCKLWLDVMSRSAVKKWCDDGAGYCGSSHECRFIATFREQTPDDMDYCALIMWLETMVPGLKATSVGRNHLSLEDLVVMPGFASNTAVLTQLEREKDPLKVVSTIRNAFKHAHSMRVFPKMSFIGGGTGGSDTKTNRTLTRKMVSEICDIANQSLKCMFLKLSSNGARDVPSDWEEKSAWDLEFNPDHSAVPRFLVKHWEDLNEIPRQIMSVAWYIASQCPVVDGYVLDNVTIPGRQAHTGMGSLRRWDVTGTCKRIRNVVNEFKPSRDETETMKAITSAAEAFNSVRNHIAHRPSRSDYALDWVTSTEFAKRYSNMKAALQSVLEGAVTLANGTHTLSDIIELRDAGGVSKDFGGCGNSLYPPPSAAVVYSRRKEIDFIVERLSTGSPGQGRAVIIQGRSGSGKTEVTAAVCQLLNSEHHAVLYVDGSEACGTEKNILIEELHERLFGEKKPNLPSGQGTTDPMETAQSAVEQYLTNLNAYEGGPGTLPYLLILDTIDITVGSPEGRNASVFEWIQGIAARRRLAGHIVITCHDANEENEWRRSLTDPGSINVAETLVLEPFGIDDAVQFVVHKSGRIISNRESCAASGNSSRSECFEDNAYVFKDQRDKLAVVIKGIHANPITLGVAAALLNAVDWKVSELQLGADDEGAEAASTANIPPDWLRKLLDYIEKRSPGVQNMAVVLGLMGGIAPPGMLMWTHKRHRNRSSSEGPSDDDEDAFNQDGDDMCGRYFLAKKIGEGVYRMHSKMVDALTLNIGMLMDKQIVQNVLTDARGCVIYTAVVHYIYGSPYTSFCWAKRMLRMFEVPKQNGDVMSFLKSETTIVTILATQAWVGFMEPQRLDTSPRMIAIFKESKDLCDRVRSIEFKICGKARGRTDHFRQLFQNVALLWEAKTTGKHLQDLSLCETIVQEPKVDFQGSNAEETRRAYLFYRLGLCSGVTRLAMAKAPIKLPHGCRDFPQPEKYCNGGKETLAKVLSHFHASIRTLWEAVHKWVSFWPDKDNELPLVKKCYGGFFTILLDKIGKSGSLEEAEGIVREMESLGIEKTLDTHTSLIVMYSYQNKYNEAKARFDRMIEQGFEPDAKSFTTLIGCSTRLARKEKRNRVEAQKIEHWKHGRDLFEDMRQRGVKLETVSCDALMQNISVTGTLEEAQTHLDFMKQNRVKRSDLTYSTLISMCNNAKVRPDLRVSRAERFFKNMQDEGITATIFCIQAMKWVYGAQKFPSRRTYRA